MGLETVKEEILSNAREQSNSITAEARREASRITREAERKMEDMKEKSEAETKKILDIIKRQELATAELENKKMILEAKKQIIESVFSEAVKKLEALDDKKRESYVKKLLEKAKNDINIFHVYCNKEDSKFLKDFKAEAANIIGGLMAENKEKTIRVDYSFETLLQSIKENELQNINKVLFV